MSCDDIITLDDLRRILGVDKMAIGSAVRSGESIHLDTSFGGFELFRMEDVENCAGIMNWREWEFVVIEVHYLELFEHVINSFGKGDLLVGFKVVYYLLCCHVFVGDFKRDHHQRYFPLES